MKIEVEVYIIDDYDTRTIKIKGIRPCCDEMMGTKMFDIAFCDPDDERPTLCLKEKQYDYSWDSDIEWENYYEVGYCPFCGVPVSICVEKTINEVDSYEKYKSRRDSLCEKVRMLDSKSECAKINNEIKKLDKEMDWYFTNDSIHAVDRDGECKWKLI